MSHMDSGAILLPLAKTLTWMMMRLLIGGKNFSINLIKIIRKALSVLRALLTIIIEF